MSSCHGDGDAEEVEEREEEDGKGTDKWETGGGGGGVKAMSATSRPQEKCRLEPRYRGTREAQPLHWERTGRKEKKEELVRTTNKSRRVRSAGGGSRDCEGGEESIGF